MYGLQLCRNRVHPYFPGITAVDFTVDTNQYHYAWASPSTLEIQTQMRALGEYCDI